MMKSESRINGGGGPAVHLSWADEVEKEEQQQEEAAQSQLHHNQKPNPFGYAKPREVVLRERGTDWRNLDLHHQQPSILRHESVTENKMEFKENMPVTGLVHSEEGKQRDANGGFDLLAVPNYMPVIVVPPLRYPPRNIVASMSQPRHLRELDNGYQAFLQRSNLNMHHSYSNGMQKVQRSQRIGRSKCHEQKLHFEQESQFKRENNKFQHGQSVGKGRDSQKPVGYGQRQHSDADHARGQMKHDGQNVMDSLLGKPPI
ncbi:uncharacterized protein LOC126688324 [Mercurialis annua]|uniref:uncharacterized protein LOC126688324 n=1 Tax=Mercurialis annua TaxID=3986 RepID=UPI002160FDE4|nr:uncharacterized protein LOC126688324 [Mercurialis annua]